MPRYNNATGVLYVIVVLVLLYLWMYSKDTKKQMSIEEHLIEENKKHEDEEKSRKLSLFIHCADADSDVKNICRDVDLVATIDSPSWKKCQETLVASVAPECRLFLETYRL